MLQSSQTRPIAYNQGSQKFQKISVGVMLIFLWRIGDYAIKIADKYKTQKGAFPLPRYNIVSLNLYIKKLVEQAG